METRCSKDTLPEQAGYFTVPGAHLYTVVHKVKDPLARVLLIGPFAAERHFSYHPWVRWARYLAARQIEAIRYDYRGVSESTGIFEEISFQGWSEDVQHLARWAASLSPTVPVLLHGLEMGAILAARCFHEGEGDALLLWSLPRNANQVLRSSLLRWAGLEQLMESPGKRIAASEYIRQLEQGSSIEVNGYQWSSRLWCDSFQFDAPAAISDEKVSYEIHKRPVKIVRFGKDDVYLTMPYTRYDETRDLSLLYARTCAWIAVALLSASEASQ